MLIGDVEYRPNSQLEHVSKMAIPCSHESLHVCENGKTGFVQFLPTNRHRCLRLDRVHRPSLQNAMPEYVYLMARSDAIS